MENIQFMESPIGRLGIAEENGAITGLFFAQNSGRGPCGQETPLLREAACQLTAYFAGERKLFELLLAPAGTPFQQAVWKALCEIPYGQTRCYSEIAAQVGNPRACRAVGMANNRNPIAVIIPCHRVVGKDRSLTGYAGGLAAKQWLLGLEASAPQG